MTGRFISFEGSEGSGKSTQAERLAGRLRELGHEVVATREPGGTHLGEAIRHLVKHGVEGETIENEAEALLFAASRAQIVQRVILPALRRGVWVVCDRFADSTTAYQAHARGLDPERIRVLNALATGGVMPDVTFLLDLDVDRAFERLGRRNAENGGRHDRIEREDRSFHERVRQGYLAIAADNPERVMTVDAARPVDAVAADIWQRLREWMDRDPGK